MKTKKPRTVAAYLKYLREHAMNDKNEYADGNALHIEWIQSPLNANMKQAGLIYDREMIDNDRRDELFFCDAEACAAHERHVLKKLAHKGCADVREAVAKNKHSSGATLALLAQDLHAIVRLAVANHPACPPHVLAALAIDPHPAIRAAIINRKQL